MRYAQLSLLTHHALDARAQRCMHMCSTAVVKQIGYTTNDPFRLMEDIQLLRPHFVALVPRVLNRMCLAMSAAGDAPGLRGALFRRAVEAKVHNLRTTGELTHPLWDRLVFKKVSPSSHLPLSLRLPLPPSADPLTSRRRSTKCSAGG